MSSPVGTGIVPGTSWRGCGVGRSATDLATGNTIRCEAGSPSDAHLPPHPGRLREHQETSRRYEPKTLGEGSRDEYRSKIRKGGAMTMIRATVPELGRVGAGSGKTLPSETSPFGRAAAPR